MLERMRREMNMEEGLTYEIFMRVTIILAAMTAGIIFVTLINIFTMVGPVPTIIAIIGGLATALSEVAQERA